MTAFPDQRHDHARCMAEALDRAEALCAKARVRLTPQRRRVLELVWASHEPVGAYEILEKLSEEQGRTAPPTVYRALDFLLQQGLVHRIESLNAFVGCPDPAHAHSGQFLICDGCRTAVEVENRAVDRAIAGSAADAGFAVSGRVVEVHGLCRHCQGEAGER